MIPKYLSICYPKWDLPNPKMWAVRYYSILQEANGHKGSFLLGLCSLPQAMSPLHSTPVYTVIPYLLTPSFLSSIHC